MVHPYIPKGVFVEGLIFLTSYNSLYIHDFLIDSSYAVSVIGPDDESDVITSYAASAASMPDFIAVCVPFILGTFRNPAVQPIRAPPGKTNFGID
jgi:hypothetical protein